MRYKLDIREIQSDHILAFPTTIRTEYIEAKSINEVDVYIAKLKDDHGNKFKKATIKNKKLFDVDYTSMTGAIKITEIKFEKLPPMTKSRITKK